MSWLSKENARCKWLLVSLAIPVGVGGMSAFLSMDGMKRFQQIVKPPFTPPGWVFMVAWTLLYLMMGYASRMVWCSEGARKQKEKALRWYGAQLAANFLWSPLFFRWEQYLPALIWLVLLLVLVVVTAAKFAKFNKKAGLLLVPYICWLLFAAYLNAGVWILKR